MFKIFNNDCLLQMQKMIADNQKVDCIVTSPPYWGLRDYGHHKQIGLEDSIEDYVCKICDVFDLCYDLLEDYGTLWLNMGDTYGGSGNGTTKNVDKNLYKKNSKQVYIMDDDKVKSKHYKNSTLNKSQLMIPHRVVIELLNRGWKCRNTIIWHKPNQMPSSASDRFTQDFEYIFLLVKENKYYFKQQFEPYTSEMNRWGGEILDADNHSNWDESTGQNTYRKRNLRPNVNGRNKRTVWSINTQTNGNNHFATYPVDLCITPIEAGCPMYVCKCCNSTYSHEIDKCECSSKDLRKGLVFDPFMGTATTGVAALNLNRDFIGVELNEEYFNMSQTRLNQSTDLFNF